MFSNIISKKDCLTGLLALLALLAGCAEDPWRHYNSFTGLSGEGITTFVVSPDTSVWVTYEPKCRSAPVGHYLPGHGWEAHGESKGLPDSSIIRDMKFGGDNSLWAVSVGVGVAHWNGKKWRVHTPEDGLLSRFVWDIFPVGKRELWVIYEGETRLSRWDGESWTSYGVLEGLLPAAPQGVVGSTDGTVWVHYGGLPVGICRFRDDTWTALDTTSGLLRNRVGELIADSAGGVWAKYATIVLDTSDLIFNDPAGLNYLIGDSVYSYTAEVSLASNSIDRVYISRDGSSWITYEEPLGISRFDRGEIRLYTTADGLAYNSVGTLALGVQDTVWVTHWGLTALSRFDGSRWRKFVTGKFGSSPLYSLVVSPTGTVWGTMHGGIVKYRKGEWEHFGVWEGLAGQEMRSIHMTLDGTLWLIYANSQCSDHRITRSGGGT